MKGISKRMYMRSIKALTGRNVEILGHESMRKYAVLLPVVHYQDEDCILFEKRSLNINQPGEICFPGGSFEAADKDLSVTVIRETCEELGLKPANIDIIAPLDTLVLFNIIIYPFIGVIDNYLEVNANKNEVEDVLYIPIRVLLELEPLEKKMDINLALPNDYPFHLIPQGEKYPFRKGTLTHYFYIWEDNVIWGLTARILLHFLELLKGK